MKQLVLEFGPEPYSFLYAEAANDPVYDSQLYRRSRERRDAFNQLDKRAMRRELYRRQAGRCDGCARRFVDCGESHLDHRIALINGGDNAPCNVRLLCRPCHSMKTSMDMLLYGRRRTRTG